VIEAKDEPSPIDEGDHPFDIADTFAKLAANDYNVPAREELVEEAAICSEAEPGAAKPPRTGDFIVKVLEREFGVLTREGEVEEFMKETDCALLTEATILVCFPTFLALCPTHVLLIHSNSGYLSND
jgi:hypothetical protein